MPYIIYKATSKTTGKSYIGFTNNLSRRKALHKFSAKRGSGILFHQSIRDLGFDNFVWETLHEDKSKDACFNTKEQEFITIYNTIEEGYNTARGGNRSGALSHQMKCKLNNGRKGKTFQQMYGSRSDEIRDKLKNSLIGYYKEHPDARKGMNNTNIDLTKYHFQNQTLDLDFIGKRFDFFNEFGFSQSDKSNMCQVLKGKLNHCKGWRLLPI